ncbi:hypothetical protein ACWEPN_04055, partial [Nonomuraea wenchangensis]
DTGGVHAVRRVGGAWTSAVLDEGVRRIGRPQHRASPAADRVAYVDEAGHLSMAVRTGDVWTVTDVTEAAGLPLASPAGGLAQWSSRSGFEDDVHAPGNLLRNPAFTDGPTNPSEVAAAWTTWTQGAPRRVLATGLRSSTPGSPGSGRVMHVSATIPGAGLVQVFGAEQHAGRQRVEASAWVFVNRGEVGIGTGDGGNTGYDVRCSTTGRWVRMSAVNGVSPANEFIVYASGPDGADFLVAGASVREPGGTYETDSAWHLLYAGADGQVCQATFLPRAGGWRFTDLGAASGAPVCKAGTDLAAWLDAAGDQHVTYWGRDGQQYEITGSEDRSQWAVRRFGPPDLGRHATRTAITAVSGDGRVVVVGSAADDTLRQLTSPQGAGPWEATALPGPGPAARESVTAWMDDTGVTVVTVSPDREVHAATRAAGATGWSVTTLTSEAPRA